MVVPVKSMVGPQSHRLQTGDRRQLFHSIPGVCLHGSLRLGGIRRRLSLHRFHANLGTARAGRSRTRLLRDDAHAARPHRRRTPVLPQRPFIDQTCETDWPYALK